MVAVVRTAGLVHICFIWCPSSPPGSNFPHICSVKNQWFKSRNEGRKEKERTFWDQLHPWFWKAWFLFKTFALLVTLSQDSLLMSMCFYVIVTDLTLFLSPLLSQWSFYTVIWLPWSLYGNLCSSLEQRIVHSMSWWIMVSSVFFLHISAGADVTNGALIYYFTFQIDYLNHTAGYHRAALTGMSF